MCNSILDSPLSSQDNLCMKRLSTSSTMCQWRRFLSCGTLFMIRNSLRATSCKILTSICLEWKVKIIVMPFKLGGFYMLFFMQELCMCFALILLHITTSCWIMDRCLDFGLQGISCMEHVFLLLTFCLSWGPTPIHYQVQFVLLWCSLPISWYLVLSL